MARRVNRPKHPKGSSVTLSRVAQWNGNLRNGYRDRFAFVNGRRFKVSADNLGPMWWVEEVDADGVFIGGHDYDCGALAAWAFGLAEARDLIAAEVYGPAS